jgi:hypothetical protein
LVVDQDNIILNCYRLADRFHQNPEVFINLPLSRLAMHIKYTVKLIDAQNWERRRRRDEDD